MPGDILQRLLDTLFRHLVFRIELQRGFFKRLIGTSLDIVDSYQIIEDLQDFNIYKSFEGIRKMSEEKRKKGIKKLINDKALSYLDSKVD